MKVTKMHGIGNDYVYVDGFSEDIEDPPRLARLVSNRHFGVGGDGLIIIRPPSTAEGDCRMEMYNADGSRAQMCGNGIRCVAKFVRDRNIVDSDTIRVESDAGLRVIEIVPVTAGKGRDAVALRAGETLVRVGMGNPGLAQKSLPAALRGAPDDQAVDAPLEVPDLGTVVVTLVSMGNPHCVVRLDEHQPSELRAPLHGLPLDRIGPLFEQHEAFPERINTEFVERVNDHELDFRVWERGSGETLACGTGACAAVVAGSLGGWLSRRATVHLRGGDLLIEWDDASGEVFMTGSATEVFTAELSPGWLEGASA